MSDFHIDVYPVRDVCIVKGQGAYVRDDQGNKYLDCVSGHGVACLGHCHPEFTRVLKDQAEKLTVCPNIFKNDVRERALKSLADITKCQQLFLCNSGAEAVEGAIKFARFLTGKAGIISMVSGFHGRTAGALSVTWNPKYRETFEPLLPQINRIPFNDIDAFKQAVNADTAAVIVEIIQGEGGVIPASPAYLKALRLFCDEKNILLILDEVQTGFGRTGAMFAHQHFNIKPDIMTLAKGMANGLPMGAIAFYMDTTGKIKKGYHGSTFGGNPLVCAAAECVIDILKKDRLPERAEALGKKAIEKLNLELRSVDLVREVRGRGLMIGIELRQRVVSILKKLMEERILALPAGPNVIRLLPPLIIDETDFMNAIDIIIQILKDANREFIA